MWWATLAEARRALDGTHPVQRQSPPIRLRSTTATFRSSVAANSAATMPPEPNPMMTRADSSAITDVRRHGRPHQINEVVAVERLERSLAHPRQASLEPTQGVAAP